MERAVESVKALSRKRQLTQAELLELIAACHDAARLFSVLIEEEGSPSEGPKVKYLRDEVRKAHQSALIQKEPSLSEDSVRRLGQCVELLGEVAQKVPTSKKLQFSAAVAPPQQQTAPPEHVDDEHETISHDDDDEEDFELDSEAEFLAQVEADRQQQMGPAAWHVRLLSILTLLVMILACVGVVFVSSDQYDQQLEAEETNVLYTLLGIAHDGLDTITGISSAASLTTNAERFLNDMSALRVSATSPPVFRPSTTPLMEFISVRYHTNDADGSRTFDRYMPRKYRLLCMDDQVLAVESDHDLSYTTNRTKNVLHSDKCKTQTSGSGIFRRLGSGFFTYLPSSGVYRGTVARQLGVVHSGTGVGLEVQVERESLATAIRPHDEVVGVRNPLAYKWQRSTALWAAFAIGIGFLFCVAASEASLWLAKEERLSDIATVGVYALSVGLISLIVVISTASISWSFLSDELYHHRLMHQQLVAYASSAALSSTTLAALGGTQQLLALLLSQSLNGSAFTTDLSTGAVYPQTTSAVRAGWLSNSFEVARGGTYYSSATYKSPNNQQLLATTQYMPAIPLTLTVYREVGMGNVILDAGKRSAGPTLGVLGAQIVLILTYYLLTPLYFCWPFAGGAVWMEQLLKPCNYRRVLYVLTTAVVLAVSLAVAFSAVSGLVEQQTSLADSSGSSIAQALSVATTSAYVTDLSVINKGLPSFADATVYRYRGSLGYFASDQMPRFPTPSWTGWEENNYGAALALSNISTSVLTPAYFTSEIVDEGWSRTDPSSIEWMLTSTAADAAGSVGVSFQRFSNSYEASPMRAYRIYASFVFAALFSCIIAFSVFEVCYRSAANARETDEYDDPSTTRVQNITMMLVLLLPIFAVLIGAGGSASTIRTTVDEHAHRELTWQVASMKPILEHVAATAAAVANADDNQILTAMSDFVDDLNDRAAHTLPAYYRWMLLQEADDLTMTKVYPIAGSDTRNSFFLDRLNQMPLQPQMGTISTRFFSSATRRTVTYSAVEVMNSLKAASTPKPATFLMLMADFADVDDRSKHVMAQLYKVSGTCTVALAIVVWMTFAYCFFLFEAKDYPVLDEDEVLPIITTETAIDHQDVAPPMLPRTMRFLHIFVFSVVVVVLVFFLASMTCGVQYTRSAVEYASQVSSVYMKLVQDTLQATHGLNYVMSTLVSENNALSQFVTETLSHPESINGTTWVNATAGGAVLSSLRGALAATNSLAAYDGTTLVESFTESFHAMALRAFEPYENGDSVFSMLESVSARLQVCSKRVASSTTAVPASFNASAVAIAIFHITEMIDAISKLAVLKHVAVNSLLDFSDTLSSAYAMELRNDATEVKAAIRATAQELQNRVSLVGGNLTVVLHSALSACDSQDTNIAVSAVTTVVTHVRTGNFILQPTLGVWTTQRKHIMEVYTALNGDTSGLAASVSSAVVTLLAYSATGADALLQELNSRRLKNYKLQRDALHTLPRWSYSAPWSLSERVHVITDARGLYDAAVATTVIALVLIALSYSVLSFLTFLRVAVHSHDVAIAHSPVGNDQEGSEDFDFLLDKATHLHRAKHVKSVLVVVASLVVLCIPVGMAHWIATESAEASIDQIVNGEVAVLLQRVVDSIPLFNDRLMFYSVASWLVGSASTLPVELAQFRHLVTQVQELMMLRKRLAIRQYQSTGSTISDAEAYRVSMLLTSLQSIQSTLEHIQQNFTSEADAFFTSVANDVTGASNASNPIIMQQRLAASYARRLVNATTMERDAVLAPIAPVMSTSSLAAFVSDTYQEMLGNCSAATTDDAKHAVANQLVAFSLTLSSADHVLKGFTDFWILQAASRRHATSSIRSHGNFQHLSAAYLASSTPFTTAVRSDIAAMFFRLVQQTAPGTEAVEILFSSTPLPPWSTTFGASTDLADQNLAAAACSTFFNTTLTMATFRQRFAFNRGLLSSTALALNEDYAVPTVQLLATLQSAVGNLTTWRSVSDLPDLVDARVPEGNNLAYRLVATAATSLSAYYGVENPEYAAVAVEWTCVVALWVSFAAFVHLVIHMRVLFL